MPPTLDPLLPEGPCSPAFPPSSFTTPVCCWFLELCVHVATCGFFSLFRLSTWDARLVLLCSFLPGVLSPPAHPLSLSSPQPAHHGPPGLARAAQPPAPWPGSEDSAAVAPLPPKPRASGARLRQGLSLQAWAEVALPGQGNVGGCSEAPSCHQQYLILLSAGERQRGASNSHTAPHLRRPFTLFGSCSCSLLPTSHLGPFCREPHAWLPHFFSSLLTHGLIRGPLCPLQENVPPPSAIVTHCPPPLLHSALSPPDT